MDIQSLLNPEPESGPISNASNPYSTVTTRDDRIAIRTALLFKIPKADICKTLQVTRRQIWLARHSRVTPQKHNCGRKPLLKTPKRKELEEWLLESPSHRRIRYDLIPLHAPQLELERVGKHALQTAFRLEGYARRTSKKKGFSSDPAVMNERLEFAKIGITWSRERLLLQMFSDEVWAMGGAHTVSYVTVKADGSNRYTLENVSHKYSKAPAWMFHGTIFKGKKGPAVFWEKEWGNMKSLTYNTYILTPLAQFLHEHPEFYFMQDNASCHRSAETQRNLQSYRITAIQ